MKEETLNSEWNYGAEYLRVIRSLENDIIEANRNADLDFWLICLEDLYSELDRRMLPEEREEAKKLILQARNSLNNKGSNARNKYFNNGTVMNKTELRNATNYLKEIIKKRKMDLPTQEKVRAMFEK